MLQRSVAIVLGLAVVLPLLASSGLRTITPEPDLDAALAAIEPWPTAPPGNYELCSNPRADRDSCITRAEVAARRADFERRITKRADEQDAAIARHEIMHAAFTERLFLTLMLFGLLVTGVAGRVRSATVSTGLILGGLGSIALGHVDYWHQMPDAWRFVSLLTALALLLWLGRRTLSLSAQPS